MVFEAPNYNRTRTTMVRGLRDLEDQKVWNRFFESYWKLIYHSARKAGLEDADAQEVVQETVITVTKKIGGFDYDRSKGSFKGWLMQTTKWKVLDQFRKINRNANRELSLRKISGRPNRTVTKEFCDNAYRPGFTILA